LKIKDGWWKKASFFASVWQNQDDCADKRRRTGKIVRRFADLQFRRLDSLVARRTFYQLPRLGKRRLVAPPVDGGATKLLEGLPPEKLYQFDWSPDGKQFAFTRGREVREVVLIENFK